jgi:hypothetical protein
MNKIYLILTENLESIETTYVCYTENKSDAEKFCESRNFPQNKVAYIFKEVPKLVIEVKLKYIIEGVEYA